MRRSVCGTTRDCAECETHVGKIDQIDRQIDLIGPLDEQQGQRLLAIANMCPMHRALHAEVHVTSTLI